MDELGIRVEVSEMTYARAAWHLEARVIRMDARKTIGYTKLIRAYASIC